MYVANATSIAASGVQTVQIQFGTAYTFWKVAAGCQPTSGGSAFLNYRDAFQFQISRTNGDKLYTFALPANVGAGTPERPLVLPEPWYVAMGETLLVDFTNLSGSQACTPTVMLIGVESRAY
jgi:hypothetical protein